MDNKLLAQLKTWNPWWNGGLKSLERLNDPQYKRELFSTVCDEFLNADQIVSLVGMRQVGKSTMLRQIIRELLERGIDPSCILYVSFDDPFLQTHMDQKQVFYDVLNVYGEALLGHPVEEHTGQLYFFFDEIHQLPNWAKILKSFYDRPFKIKYAVSGSSSIHIQSKNHESLLGRMTEYVLWPFSFREFVEYNALEDGDEQLLKFIKEVRNSGKRYKQMFGVQNFHDIVKGVYTQGVVWHKEKIIDLLKQFILVGGFPRVWEKSDLFSRQKFLWDQHVGKVLFEDLVQIANIRRPKALEFLFARVIDFNGKEVALTDLQGDLQINHATLDKYISYLTRTFLTFRLEKTKSKRIAVKKKAGNVKFYVTDIAVRNAFYRFDGDVYQNNQEMAIIAENLVCSVMARWLRGPHREEQVSFYRDQSGEIDFLFKSPSVVLPVEVKWREQVPSLKTVDNIMKKWDLDHSILVTKDHELSWDGRHLSIPLWFFLLAF